MNKNNIQLEFDKNHIWHPYASMTNPLSTHKVESANGVFLKMADGKSLIDGMSSWWSVIHGYNNPTIINAVEKQLKKLPHVMFGGLTHEPAIELANLLLKLLPDSLEKVFFSDSGSVAVEVALKMAIQYHYANNNKQKTKFITFRGGYHGDTFGAMSVCDPETGMHSMFASSLKQNVFLEKPDCSFKSKWKSEYFENSKRLIEKQADSCCAVIVEPIVQGAGGMSFYHPEYLRELRRICDENNLLLIFDEIATGFGRSGKLFALEHAEVIPDIICVGKALTGGTMTMAATITNKEVARMVSSTTSGCLMHGPTFMANPLACSAAIASIELLNSGAWKEQVDNIQKLLNNGLSVLFENKNVKEVRVLGAIGVVELNNPVNMEEITKFFVDNGVWIRPFGKLLYIMPPYIISEQELNKLIDVIVRWVNKI